MPESDDRKNTPQRLIARISIVVARDDGSKTLRREMDANYFPLDVEAASHDDLRISVMRFVDNALVSIGVPPPHVIGSTFDPAQAGNIHDQTHAEALARAQNASAGASN